MKNSNKQILVIIFGCLFVGFFGYTWLSKSYNNPNYNYLDNYISQFLFASSLTFLIYRILELINYEKKFPVIIILLIIVLLILASKGLFFFSSLAVLILALIIFYTKKWL